MSKSVIYSALTTPTAVAVGEVIPLGPIVRRYGCINQSGNVINIAERGYYSVDVSVTAEATAVGDITITLIDDGVPVTGATASVTAAAVGDLVNLDIAAVVRVFCEGSQRLAVVLGDTTATINNMAVVVEKL